MVSGKVSLVRLFLLAFRKGIVNFIDFVAFAKTNFGTSVTRIILSIIFVATALLATGLRIDGAQDQHSCKFYL